MKNGWIKDVWGHLACYKDDLLHCEDGPAFIGANGSKEWWLNGKRHREDGPAVIVFNGNQEWWVNNERHREDGPAVIWAKGTKEWWFNGKIVTEEDVNFRFNQVADDLIKNTKQKSEIPHKLVYRISYKIIWDRWLTFQTDSGRSEVVFHDSLGHDTCSQCQPWLNEMMEKTLTIFRALDIVRNDPQAFHDFCVEFHRVVFYGDEFASFYSSESEREIIIDCNGTEVVILEAQVAKFKF